MHHGPWPETPQARKSQRVTRRACSKKSHKNGGKKKYARGLDNSGNIEGHSSAVLAPRRKSHLPGWLGRSGLRRSAASGRAVAGDGAGDGSKPPLVYISDIIYKLAKAAALPV